MKRYVNAFAMCQSMFCAFPFPLKIWDEEARDQMLLFLPLVGLEIGGLWALVAWLTAGVPALVRGAILCAWPFLASGFIHLDGFMDVCDAVGSCRSLERRREILKDPHVGSFAVIGLALLMVSQFALCASAPEHFGILVLIPVVSRCCSVLAVTLLPPMESSQYATWKPRKQEAMLPGVLLALCILLGYCFCGLTANSLLGGLIGYLMGLRKGYSALEGMNGDISGFALTVSEVSALAVWVLG